MTTEQRVLIASVVSKAGDVAFEMSLMVWLGTQLLGGSQWAPVAVSALFIVAGGVTAIGGPMAGWAVDRYPRRALLRGSLVVQAVAALAMAGAVVAIDHVPTLLVVMAAATALGNAGAQVFQPARLCLVQDLVDEERHPVFFSRLASLAQVTLIAVPLAAVPLTLWWGVVPLLVLNAASFVLSFLLLSPIQWSPGRPEEDGSTPSLTSAVTSVWRHPVARRLSAALAVVSAVGGVVNVLELFFVTRVLGEQAALLGPMVGLMGAGVVVGAWVSPRLQSRAGGESVVWWGVVGVGLALSATALSPGPGWAAGGMAALGLAQGVVMSAFMPVLLASVDPSALGRVSNGVNVLPSVVALVCMAGAGAAASWADAATAFPVVGGLHPVAALWIAAGAVTALLGGIGLFARGRSNAQRVSATATR